MKHNATVANGVPIGHMPDHVITAYMRLIVNRIPLPGLIRINTVCLKVFGNPVFFPKANRAKNICIISADHIAKISLSEITRKTAFAKTIITFLAFPNMIKLFVITAAIIFIIT